MEIKKLKITKNNIEFEDADLLVEIGESNWVRLIFKDYDSGMIIGKTIYESMRNLQVMLDQDKIKLLCNCFRFDMRPSRMSHSMGGGLLAYKLILGIPGKDRFNIFEPTDDADAIVSQKEQDEYYRKWLNSLG